jgi:hypothetical protein
MSAKNNQPRKMNLLVCGSKQFEDKAFVFGMLNNLFVQTGGGISTLSTSRFSGACQYAREWLEIQNSTLPADAKIEHKDCTFDMHLAKQNLSFYEEADLPEVVIQHDPFFQEGKEKLISSGINAVIGFPNSEGEMGPATNNIRRFAELSGIIGFINGVEAYDMLKDFREQEKQAPVVKKDGLQNQHGMKR